MDEPVLGLLQARMSSSRLPGKVMRPILGEPMIGRQIERLRRSRRITTLVVATSDEVSDDPLAAYVQSLGVPVHRGSLSDVLGRMAGAARRYGPAAAVARLTADCPLIDWRLVDACVSLFLDGRFDYAANDMPPRFPRGLDVEVMTAEALFAADLEATDLYDREHVTPFIRGRPDRFRIGGLVQSPDRSDLRWTVDTPQDFRFVEAVFERLHVADPDFDAAAIAACGLTRTESDAEKERA